MKGLLWPLLWLLCRLDGHPPAPEFWSGRSSTQYREILLDEIRANPRIEFFDVACACGRRWVRVANR